MARSEPSARSVEPVREGQCIAEAEVELIETESEWSPYLSLVEAEKLEVIRSPLRRGDLTAAGKIGKICQLTPVAAE